jgi:hypothetical protein
MDNFPPRGRDTSAENENWQDRLAQVTEYNEELLPTNSDRLSAHPNDRVDGAPMHIRGATHSLDETCRTSVCHY